jgi:pectinesterase
MATPVTEPWGRSLPHPLVRAKNHRAPNLGGHDTLLGIRTPRPCLRVVSWGLLAAATACSGRGELLGSKDAPPGTDAAILPSSSGVSFTSLHIVVAADGSGQFRSVQAALDSVPAGTNTPVEIDVRPGTYNERVTISDRGYVTLVGEDALTTIITNSLDATDAGGTGRSATVTALSSDFSVSNITFQNSSPQDGAQAVALFASGDRQQFSNCRFMSYQDTLYLTSGSQYFRSSFVQGDDDYILGAATAVFQDCTIYQISGGVAVTAPNTDPATSFGFVFLGGSLAAGPGVGAGSVALGRPWGAYGSATYVGTVLGPHISPVGWVPMGTNGLTLARFAEYQTTGPGADAAMRADGSRQLTSAEAAALTIATMFGSWTPSFSL